MPNVVTNTITKLKFRSRRKHWAGKIIVVPSACKSTAILAGMPLIVSGGSGGVVLFIFQSLKTKNFVLSLESSSCISKD